MTQIESQISQKLSAKNIRLKFNDSKIINLNLSYISNLVDNWWGEFKDKQMKPYYLKLELTSFLLKFIKIEDKNILNQIGNNNIVGISCSKIFNNDDPNLALLIHESMCDLVGLNDTNYPYENHKNLYLKAEGMNYKEWGNGYGEITPHQDDLYEEISTDLLALTVCRDKTNTPTTLILSKDIINQLSDEEIEKLYNLEVEFISGKNVEIIKKRKATILKVNENNMLKFFLDCRVDNLTGERMIAINKDYEQLLNKIKHIALNTNPILANTSTGTFTVIDNHNVLHSRGKLNLDEKTANQIANSSNFFTIPRLLYRSKGPIHNIKFAKQG
jgi:hypothetical protein